MGSLRKGVARRWRVCETEEENREIERCLRYALLDTLPTLVDRLTNTHIAWLFELRLQHPTYVCNPLIRYIIYLYIPRVWAAAPPHCRNSTWLVEIAAMMETCAQGARQLNVH